MTFTASTYDALGEGIYPAVVTGITEGSNEFGGFRKWAFEVTTPSGPHSLTAMTSDASGPRSKAYRWASTLLGHKPTGEEEALVGLACQLHLIVNDDGFNRIESVLPPTSGSTVNLNRLDEQVFSQPKLQDAVPF